MGELTQSQIVDVAGELFDPSSVIQPIHGDPSGKNLLYMEQLAAEDIYNYIEEAYAAESLIKDPAKNGINLLPRVVLKAVMRQPSTRTGGSMVTAMLKLGGCAELISGMESSSEAKGETLSDSWVAFATQSDIIGTRTKEDWGPALAAFAIDRSFNYGKLSKRVPVINLGDGTKEHPTQALGDLFTIHKRFGGQLEGLKIAIVGDHERYRAHHSLMIGAAAVGMKIITVESSVAPVPDYVLDKVKNSITAQKMDMDEAMMEADVLCMGRNPDEYTVTESDDQEKIDKERIRTAQLNDAYESWRVTKARLQKMPEDSIVIHPRPRREELDPDVDDDPRMADVEQMESMVPIREAIISRHAGKSIVKAIEAAHAQAS